MASEARMPPEDGTARARAASAARLGASDASESVLMVSIAWSLVSIADDLAALRREAEWQRRHGPRTATRG